MNASNRILLVVAIAAAGCGGGVSSDQLQTSSGSLSGHAHARVCAPDRGGARCHSWVRVDASGSPAATVGPTGYNPTDLQSAYKLAAGSGTPTVAIVDAFDDPNAESDLAVYRSTFGLPPCTTSNGCFRKVNQNGGTSFPRRNAGWAQEISLDLDMVSAICPNCHILLVEANSNSFADLSAAVDFAATVPGVVAISNSYGGAEFSGETSAEVHYNHPGIAVTVSSGDNGFGVEFPAASKFVTAVGGTTLTPASNARGWSETAWSGAGSGCSAFISKPAWQNDTGCTRRTVTDVSAIADPNTGVSVYDTFRVPGGGGWLVFGGTSVAAPIVAGIYALAMGNGISPYTAQSIYTHASSLFDVTSGSNGTCNPAYLCTAGPAYDGPTGNGTPNGTGAF